MILGSRHFLTVFNLFINYLKIVQKYLAHEVRIHYDNPRSNVQIIDYG